MSNDDSTMRQGSDAAMAPTLLIVDDMPDNLLVLGDLLRGAGYAVRAANSGAAALRQAAVEPPALILLDVMMPEMDGYEVLRRLRENDATREIPVIFLTALDDAHDVVRGLRLGAADYIAKPIQSEVVLARVQTQIEARRAREWLKDQVERKANFDDMTGLPNRHLLNDRLAHAIERCRREGGTAAVLMLNLDSFKNIYDSLGYAAGDQVLQEVAQRLGTRVRKMDTLARIEGDEFVLVVEATETEAATKLAQPLLAMLAPPFKIAGRELFLTGSIGIALFPKDGEDGEVLLRNAAAAMAKAKAGGGNRFHFYTAEMNARSLERLDMENGLRRALDMNELVVHYQPQLNLRTGAIIGAEALVRWQHPQRGLVMPGEFIPLAEESGLIVPLDEWVLRTACRQNKAWQDAGLPPLKMAVNLSAQQFAARDIVALAGTILRETGLTPDCLELELTESAVMADADAFIQATQQLKGLSITLSIDDFGTGFSSLSYLRRFAVDRLKIDRSFVCDVTHDPNSAVIAQAIISLAHSLNLSAIAEGIETEAQLNFLRSRHCDEMQGFYFSRPLSPEAFAALLREGRRLPSAAVAAAGDRTLLLVDDEPNVLNALTRLLRPDGYRILRAESGEAALGLLATHGEVGVIVSDQRMPHMSGVEFLRRAKQIHPDTVRIILSGYTELKSVTDAVNEGAVYKFLTKPWEDVSLRANIREAFQRHELRAENARLANELAAANERLSRAKGALEVEVGHSVGVLRVSQEMLELLPVGALGIDRDGMVVTANRAAREILADDPRPLPGMMAAERLPAALVEGVACVLRGAAESGGSWRSPRGVDYEFRCHVMGATSQAQGAMLAIVPAGRR